MNDLCIHCQEEFQAPISFKDLVLWKPIDQGLVCTKCFSRFQKIDPTSMCPTCSKYLDSGEVCADCQAWQDQYPDISGRHLALFYYDDFAKDWMFEFKMKGDIRFGLVFGQVLKECIKSNFPNHLLVPIPSSTPHFKDRGFNQIDVILSVLSFEYEDLLANTSHGLGQAKKTRADRLRTDQPFSYRGGGDLSQMDILLVDDVYTTGRTLYHAKRLLTDQGARRVDSLSLFR